MLFYLLWFVLIGISCANSTNCTGAIVFNMQNDNLYSNAWDELFNKNEWVFVHFWLILIYQTYGWRSIRISFKTIVYWEGFEFALSNLAQLCIYSYGNTCPWIISIDWFSETLINKVGDLVQGYIAIVVGNYFLELSGYRKGEGWKERSPMYKLRRSFELILLSIFQTTTMLYYQIDTCKPLFISGFWESLTKQNNMFAIGFVITCFGSTFIIYVMKVEDDYLFPEKKEKNDILFGFVIMYLLMNAVILVPYIFSAYLTTWITLLILLGFINFVFVDLVEKRNYEYEEDYLMRIFW